MYKKITIFILAIGMLLSLGITGFAKEDANEVTLDNYKSSLDEALLKIADETGISIEVQDIDLLIKNSISIEEFKSVAVKQITDYLLEMGLSIGEEDNPTLLNQIEPFSYPPGSSTQRFTGSGLGEVWAGIPAVGWTYIYIPYTYDYTKWHHDLYNVHGCEINSASVGNSYFNGISVGQWTHRSGSVTYDSSREALSVVATGTLLFPFSINLGHLTIPANVETEQSFVYFHYI